MKKIFILSLFFMLVLVVSANAFVPFGMSYHPVSYTNFIYGSNIDNKVVVGADIFQISPNCTGKLQLGDDSWIYDDSCDTSVNPNPQRTLYIESGDGIHIKNLDTSTGGVYVATNGKVGIGTTNPGKALDVNGSLDILGDLLINEGRFRIQGNYPAPQIELYDSGANGKNFTIISDNGEFNINDDTSSTIPFKITSSGDIGVEGSLTASNVIVAHDGIYTGGNIISAGGITSYEEICDSNGCISVAQPVVVDESSMLGNTAISNKYLKVTSGPGEFYYIPLYSLEDYTPLEYTVTVANWEHYVIAWDDYVTHYRARITITNGNGAYEYCWTAGPSPCTPDTVYTEQIVVDGNEISGPDSIWVGLKDMVSGEELSFNVDLEE